jgi:acetyl-CoA carboxylase biotin carboxyl carrier protein
MNFKEIQELLRLISRLELTEFKLKEGEFELSVRTKYYSGAKGAIPVATPVIAANAYTGMASAPVEAAPASFQTSPEMPAAAPAAPVQEGSNLVAIKSPIVGTFYRSSSPDKPPYMKIGDKVESGAVVCIIEAMKLFNEIESDVSGRIVKILVEDAQPVEYDQPLFLVDPKG